MRLWKFSLWMAYKSGGEVWVEKSMSMRMNDYSGKEFLATVRAEDYAHAGEDEASELVFKDIPAKVDRMILDAGCGRGGTADYVQRHGWGEVVGIDIEEQSIERAKEKYPACQ